MSTLPDRTTAPKVAEPRYVCARCGLASPNPNELCEPTQSSSRAHTGDGREPRLW